MDSGEGQRVIESLRKGIPPDGFVSHFTVGRQNEINQLTRWLSEQNGGALLLNANYGSGKTHLLRFIREKALAKNYAVSTITLDAGSAVRFNRMDQMFGSVLRNIELPVKCLKVPERFSGRS
jgi:chromosomal replication initiation ATPase DnaA